MNWKYFFWRAVIYLTLFITTPVVSTAALNQRNSFLVIVAFALPITIIYLIIDDIIKLGKKD